MKKKAPSRRLTSTGFDDFRRNLRAGLRLALFRPVTQREFRVSLEQALVLVLFAALLLPLVDLARSGLKSDFNSYAIPYVAFTTVLGFGAWYLLARWHGRPRQVLPMLVMSAAVAPVFYGLQLVLALIGIADFEADEWLAASATWVVTALYLAVVFRIVARLVRRSRVTHAVSTGAYALLTIAPLYLVPYQYFWTPVYEEDSTRRQVNAEQVFYAQHDLLEQAKRKLLPQRPGISDLYFVGFASYADEDVFMKELGVIRGLFDTRFDTGGRSVALINHPNTSDDTPIASATNLERMLQHVGRLMNPDEDVLVLYLTSHGSLDHQLSVDFWPLSLNTIDPDRLKQMLDASGIKWKVIIISACYSGGFVEKLRDATTLVMTSAEAGRASFGCGTLSDFTYFGQALFDVELRRTYSFLDAFHAAEQRIAERERRERRKPSLPQLAAAPEIEHKLAVLSRELERRVPVNQAATRPVSTGATSCGGRDC